MSSFGLEIKNPALWSGIMERTTAILILIVCAESTGDKWKKKGTDDRGRASYDAHRKEAKSDE